jgi:hypothetical protein
MEELNNYLRQYIEGSFSVPDMQVIHDNVCNLEPGQVYFEVGVAEGMSLSTAFYSSKEGVFCLGVDYYDSPDHRRPDFMNTIVSGNQVAYIHADAHELANIWNIPINTLFIDGAHDEDNVCMDTMNWAPHVVEGGTILYHDYDMPNAEGVIVFIDQYYKDFEVINTNIVKVIK